MKSSATLPLVSILIPMRNEEHFIAHCLNSILANDYSQDRLEILVIDGMSTDRSQEIVQEYIKSYPTIRLLKNPNYIQVTALNIGISEARGEIIIRMDAHANYAKDYIRQCVTLLLTTGATNVGGVQSAVGTGFVSNAIAIVTTSPFGTGDARFRYSNREEWVETVYLGAWYKRTLEVLGGFNEEWTVNEDYELNYRLRQAGGKILLSPRIRCQYYVRSSLKALAHQYFRYGLWKVKTLVAHPGSLRWRHLVPPVFVLAIAASLLFLAVGWNIGIIVPGCYMIMNPFASLIASRQGSWRYLPLLPVVFAIIHFSWGGGFWLGLMRFGIPRLSLKSVVYAFLPTERKIKTK